MSGLLITLGILTLIFAFSAATVTIAAYFFPSVRHLIPDGWQHWFNANYVAYFFLAGSVLLLLGKN